MTTEQELRAQRTAVQERRTEHERRERTVTDLRTIRHTLERRVRRELRDAPAVRTDEELLGHVDRLLRRHTDGDRPLVYLGEALDDVDAAAYVRNHFEREVLPAVESHVDEVTVDTGNALQDPFPSAIASFLDAARDRQAGQSEADTVHNEYRSLLDSRDTADHLRGLAVVGALVDLARLAVVGTGDDDVAGVRTALHDAREEHVASLEEADRRLLGEDEPDPYVALEWTDPVAMLPMRLETRFVGDDLKVRIYPEQLHIDAHEEQVTEAERDWGVRFWTRLWTAGVPDAETLLTVDSDVVPPEELRREEGRLVVPEKLTSGDGYAAPTELPTQDARETALELLRAFEAEEFSSDLATRYEEVRERAWADGVERFGEERAGYVLESLAPTATDDGKPVSERLRRGFETGDPPLSEPVAPSFPDVDVRPESWTKTPRASLLPDRFVVRARYEADDDREEYTDWTMVEEGDVTVMERRDGTEWVRRAAGPVVREPLAVGPSPEAVAAEEGDAATEMEWMTNFDAAEDAGLGLTVPLPTRPDYDRSVGFSMVEVTGAKTTMDDVAAAEALSDLLSATEHTEGLELLSPGKSTNNADRPSPRSEGRDPAASVDVETRRSLVGPGTDGGRLANALGVPRSTFAHVAGADDRRNHDARAMNRALWPATIGYYVRNLLVSGPGALDDDRPTADMLGTGPSETGEGPPRLLRWLETYRDHFVDHVRGGGPFQTLRAGDQPYGVLPVAPLEVGPDDRAPADVDGGSGDGDGSSDSGFYPSEVPRIRDEDFVTELIDRVWTLRDEWLGFAESVPSVGNDPALSEDELLSMLAMEATAHSYRRQLWLLGDDNPVYRFLGLDLESGELSRRVHEDLTAAGLPTFGPRMADLLFLGASLNADDLPIVDEDVTAFVDTVRDLFETTDPIRLLRTLGEDPDGLVQVPELGLEFERDAFFDVFDLTGEESDYDPAESLLRQLLRFGALQAAVASRVRLGAIYGWRDEYVEYPAEPTSYGPGDRTVFDLFGDDLPTGSPIDSGHTLTDHPDLDSSDDFLDVLRATGGAVGAPPQPPDPELADFVGALAHLAAVEPERLKRLTTETTDLASHRLDAWWTSIATRRLKDHRAANSGVQIGAYGFVEDLSPGSGPDAEYLLAPSLDQATTSAVLRSAHKARDRSDDPDTSGDESAAASALAVNCSPERVKTALPLMRAVRRGQDLSELLGYRFERGLRAYSEERGLDLERYLDDFRELAPTVEDKLPRGDTEVGIRQSDVVDGMRLYRLWKQGSLEIPLLGVLDANSLPSDLVSALGGVSLAQSREAGVFPAIHRTMEAVSDVLLAEGVHHLVHGRPEPAAAALEAHSRGETPPEPTVLDTPRSETGVTYRLLLMWGDAESPRTPHAWRPTYRAVLRPSDVQESSTGHGGGLLGGIGRGSLGDLFDGVSTPETVQVRHEAEPALGAWVGGLLPNPKTVGCTGEFQWERDREFAVGEFETPAEARPVTVDDVGFEPDVVLFTAIAAPAGDGPVSSDAAGWSHGVFKRAVGVYDEVQRATSASITADGQRSSDARDDAVAVTFPTASGDAAATVIGSVTSTTADGFEVSFHTVTPPERGPERVTVQYRAMKLADPTSVRLGYFETPESGLGDTVVADLVGNGDGDGFSPDYVTVSACFPVETPGSASNAAVGFAHGEAMVDRNDSLHQQTTGLSLDPADDEYRVSVRDDAILDVQAGNEGALRLSIDALEPLEASVSAPNPAAYPGATTVTVIAAESPQTATPGGERLHRPAVGTVAAPGSADQTLSVDTGFRPGLIEARFVPGATGAGAEDLPLETTVAAGEAYLSLGAATGTVAQRSLSTGVAGDAASVSRGVAALGTGTTTGSDGLTAGPGVRVDALDDGGFELSFSNLPEGDRPLLQYRAWPAKPESQGFATPLEWPDRPDGLSLSDLELTPLDAVALSQGVGQAGDSQLERRFGYHAFRNRPDDRPPVPDDATLDLAFAEPSPAHDVSVAEYIEVARRIRDLVGEARPADATDLAHPSEASDEGYLLRSTSSTGTAERLAARVRGDEETHGIEGKLSAIEELLTDRHDLLSADTNVCDEVADLEDAVRSFRRAAPVSQVVDVTDAVATEHPTDGPWNGAVAGTVLEELEAVAEHVRVGPTGDVDADVIVESASMQEVAGMADVSGETDVAVTVRSHSDAVHFSPKRDDSVRTDQSGGFSTQFDFSNAPPGTAFTVVAEVEGPGGAALPDPSVVLVDVVRGMDPSEQYALLVQLAAAAVFDPPSGLTAVDQFERLVEDARDAFDARVEIEELATDEELLRWRQDLQRAVLDEVERVGLPNRFERLPAERRVRLFEDLPLEGTLRALALVRRSEYVRDYLDRRAESGPVYAAAGRVVGADDRESRDLAEAIDRTTYLPWLLWLDRVLPAFGTDEGGAARPLRAAVRATPWDVVTDERDVIRTMVQVLGHRRDDSAVVSEADERAIADLVSLRDLDFRALRGALRTVIRPASWTGLTGLMTLTGARDRPAEQRHWRASEPDVAALVPKHPEGEVRARLERLREFPDTGAGAELAAYSPPLRRLVSTGRIDPRLLVCLEQFVADPAALVDAVGDVAPDLPALLADVHDLLHHAKATDPDAVGALSDRVESFLTAVDDAGRTATLGKHFNAHEDLLPLLRNAESELVGAVRSHERTGSRSDEIDTALNQYASVVESAGETVETQLSDRVIGVTAHDDASASFRAGVLESIRHVLLRASYFGIYGSVPASAAGGNVDDEETLVAQVERVRETVSERLTAAEALAPDGPPTVDGQVERLQALLGDEFVILPPFTPTNPSELHATLADDGLVDDHYETDTWLRRIARVRDLPADFQRVRTYADALSIAEGAAGGLRRSLTVGQLPNAPGSDWLGRDDVTPSGGELSLGIAFANEHDSGGDQGADAPIASDPGSNGPPLAGLLIDEWVERVPEREETIGLGLQYDDPSTRAPQSVLLAVPPTWQQTELASDDGTVDVAEHAGPTTWTTPLLRRTIDETRDLVDVRSVDLDAMERFGNLIPMLCFANNDQTLLDDSDALPDAPSVEFDALDWEWWF